MLGVNHRLPDYSLLGEPELSFDPVGGSKSDPHPLRGLASRGPYSSKLSPARVGSPIRLALITVEGHGSAVRDYLASLQGRHTSPAKSSYFPPFEGFGSVFKVDVQVPQGRRDAVALIPAQEAEEALTGSEPERVFLGLIESTVRSLLLRRTEFDVLAFYFPSFLSPVFRVGGGAYDFDLHHTTKAITANLGIPSQLIIDRSIEFQDRCSVLWSLSVALFAKAGGIPWKLSGARTGTAYIGLSYVLRTVGERRTVLTCCSQVFDDEGHGLQFLLFTADDFTVIAKNPFLKKTDMRRLMLKTLDVYVRQAGQLPKRLVVHKTTHFTREEREGAAEALGGLDDYELLQVQEETAWSAVKGARRYPTPYPVDRGTVLPISKHSYLLWTQGDAQGLVEPGRSYYQEGKGIPFPLLITQHAGSTPLLDSAAEILSLTKMNWNTGRLYNNLPVTIKSASTLGKIAKFMPSISPSPYQFRMFM